MSDLPVSELDPDDFPPGPNGLAALCEARIDELEGWKAIVPRSERRPINQHIHTLKGMVRWCKSRAGYVDMSVKSPAMPVPDSIAKDQAP